MIRRRKGGVGEVRGARCEDGVGGFCSKSLAVSALVSHPAHPARLLCGTQSLVVWAGLRHVEACEACVCASMRAMGRHEPTCTPIGAEKKRKKESQRS